MSLYFYVLDARRFRDDISPALGNAWRRRSFEPSRALCADLLPAAEAFTQRYGTGGELVLGRVAAGRAFDRNAWRLLVGEVLLFAAVDVPEVPTVPETLCWLLAGDARRDGSGPREGFTPIEQVHFGARDLTFDGACFRPTEAGYNDAGDVARLAEYLDGVDPMLGCVEDLQGLDRATDEERGEELELAREWFEPLRDLYRRTAGRMQVIVCERV